MNYFCFISVVVGVSLNLLMVPGTSGAQPIPPEFQINTTTSSSQGSSTVGMNAQGEFIVAWQDASVPLRRIMAQRYDSYGAPV